jgi:hypothetical protein
VAFAKSGQRFTIIAKEALRNTYAHGKFYFEAVFSTSLFGFYP